MAEAAVLTPRRRERRRDGGDRKRAFRSERIIKKEISLDLPVMFTSTMPVRVPMPLVASHTYVPARSKVTGPLKNSVLFRISTLVGREPFKLRRGR